MPPMAREGSADGKVTENLVEYYRLRAECTGLIIIEHAYVSIEGKSTPKQLSMADDSVIESYRNLTDAIHKEIGVESSQVGEYQGDAVYQVMYCHLCLVMTLNIYQV